MDYQHIEIRRDGSIATLTLNRPEKLNALNRRIMQEIIHAARSFGADTETRVVIFAGAGKHFCAGADLSAGRDERDTPDVSTRLKLRRSLSLGAELVSAIYGMDQITIAAIHGAALGGGACMVTACDFRVGAEGSFCGYPEVNRGMNLQWVGLPLCVHLVGPSRAKRMIALGRNEDAATLLDWGFYDEVVPREALLDRAMAMARDYAEQPPIAAQMIKESVNAVVSALDRSIMHMDRDQWMLTAGTDDYREGVKAFFEKRKAEFKGN